MAHYGIIKDKELRQAYEGSLEEWVDLEDIARKEGEWKMTKARVGAELGPLLHQRIQEQKRRFRQGTTPEGDYYRHWIRWAGNKHNYALFTYGRLYDEHQSPTGASPKMLCACDPEVWRENWRVKLNQRKSFHKRGYPSFNEAVSAIGPMDERFGRPDPSPFFAPLPESGKLDYINSIRGYETSPETFLDWKEKKW
jgi:hypothetical protein